ncbi:MAG TPA: ABC transporter ATP-binding protein [Ktedonobacterales bacterium]|jgi:peptide/nickel transport system ATP-binding protein|nr:ABC transporter ATP-binding protein [Ktedonobacterales bacterium]
MTLLWSRLTANFFSTSADSGSPIPPRPSEDSLAQSSSSPGASESLDAPVLEAAHLTKHFRVRALRLGGSPSAVHAVENVSLALYPGRVTALVGESGSGKTTVARLLAHMYMPTSGEIRLRGKRMTAYRGRAFRRYCRDVQLIFQDPFSSLNPAHKIAYHLRRPLRIHGRVQSREEETAEIISLLQRVNLTPPEQTMQKFPHELSGGQRQRIAIARALAAQPKVLLADEPISMLDVSIRLDILNLLRRLKDEDHLALLYITHDIASARYFADETLVMYAGQLVEGGPSDEVTERPAHPYSQLLLSAAPDPERFGPGNLRERRRQLPARGEIPSLITPPSGCRFHPRCPQAMEICRRQFPPRAELGGGHFAHCWLHSLSDNREPLARTPA